MTPEELKAIKKRVFHLIDKMNDNKISNDEYRELQIILIVCETVFRNDYPITKKTISGDRAIFISDSHIGNIYENLRLFYTVYNIALQNNIKLVFHLGDLIEATTNDRFRNKSYEEVLKELERAKDNMPQELTTKLLLGNHDYSAIRTFPDLIHQYFDGDKIEVLGMKHVILEWNNFTLKLYHRISQLQSLQSYSPQVDLELHGHWHSYEEDLVNRIINLPSVCKSDFDLANVNNLFFRINANYDAFVVATKIDEKLLQLDMYTINANNTISNNRSTLLDIKKKTLKKLK